jgi:hypothetical protein
MSNIFSRLFKTKAATTSQVPSAETFVASPQEIEQLEQWTASFQSLPETEEKSYFDRGYRDGQVLADQSFFETQLNLLLDAHRFKMEQENADLQKNSAAFKIRLQNAQKHGYVDQAAQLEVMLEAIQRLMQRKQEDLLAIPKGEGSGKAMAVMYQRGFEAARLARIQQSVQQLFTAYPNL